MKHISIFLLSLVWVAASVFTHAQTTACIDPDIIDPGITCPAIFDPVCGCDGITYANDCVAWNHHGVTSWTAGPCTSGGCADMEVAFGWENPIFDPFVYYFYDLSTFPGGQILERAWDLGDGASAFGQYPSHIYSEPGTYEVCLTLTGLSSDGQTCVDTLCQTISVSEFCPENCYFQILYELDDTRLSAWLQSEPVDPEYPDPIVWSLDEGAILDTGAVFEYLFPAPGQHTLCATYAGPEAHPCTVCKVFSVLAECVDTAQIDFSVPCPLFFDPVCGCDGITYGNSCEAYNYGGVTQWKPGACGSICNSLSIDFEGFPSGGSFAVWTFTSTSTFPEGQITNWNWYFGNGQVGMGESMTTNFGDTGTFEVCLQVQAITPDGTPCQGAQCQTIVIPEPLCPDPGVIDTTVGCFTLYEPVCGCDGITYSNACIAYYYHGVTVWEPGICPTDCINPLYIDPGHPCPDLFDPVCGCNQVTYANSCDALYVDGVTAWTKGICCGIENCEALFEYTAYPEEQKVVLIDQSTHASEWKWTMGDGAEIYGSFDSLVYIYNDPGTYEICLEISNPVCKDTFCVEVNLEPVWLEDEPWTSDVQVMPNPAQSHVFIQVEGAEIRDIRLLDLLGREVVTHTGKGYPIGLSWEGLPGGIYFLAVQTDRGSTIRKLVIE